jgi:predicted acylesterase/phospholipase RssA
MTDGVFLTPGAARAAYQVGAVQELVRAGVRFEVVVACSVGALNGGFVATGQVDRLAELWGGWRSRDILGVDWRALLRGAVLWAPNLMHNRPQKRNVIDAYLDESRLLAGVRLRFNLADLTGGRQQVFEFPGAPVGLREAVNASVAVPAAIKPAELLGRQWADGLTIDGFAIEELALVTGLDRLFVIGVAPRVPDASTPRTLYGVLLRALEANQFTETTLGLRRARDADAAIEAWARSVRRVDEALAGVEDDELRARLVEEAARVHDAAPFPLRRQPVEIVTILPEQPIRMFFTSYRPRRSRRLLEQGRRDAAAVLARL